MLAQIEKDKIYVIDEIVIYSSNTDEMCQEIRDRYGSKAQIFVSLTQLLNNEKHLLVVELIYLYCKMLAFKLKLKHRHPAVRDRINAVNLN